MIAPNKPECDPPIIKLDPETPNGSVVIRWLDPNELISPEGSLPDQEAAARTMELTPEELQEDRDLIRRLLKETGETGR